MKTCTKCKQTLSVSEFNKRNASKDGLSFKCRHCALFDIREWRTKNPEYSKNQSRKWREKNSEYARIKSKQWDILNANKRRALNAKRHASKLLRTPHWLTPEQLQEIEDFYVIAKAFKLYTGQEYHVDHIIPLRGDRVSGLHVPWNLQILTAKENLSKHNK